MGDLVRWLGEQLDEDERIARAATPGPWTVDAKEYPETIYAPGNVDVVAGGRWGGEASVFNSTEDAVHIAEWDPARVLREIDAKRQIVTAYLPPGGDPHPGLPCTDDIEGDPDGVFYAEQHPAEKGACVRHLEASKRLLHHDYVLRLLAAVYVDRPGYRAEWAPTE